MGDISDMVQPFDGCAHRVGVRIAIMRKALIAVLVLLSATPLFADNPNGTFTGKHFSGSGDVEYLQMLDIARRFFEPDPQYLNLAMLYEPSWNGLVEGPTWDAWWIQNSYGTTLAALPFLQEPFVTFLQNSQDLWFNQMGDGHRKGMHDWVGPDGCLCDCANLTQVYYRQGDCRVDIHDWGMEFTAAGVVMQGELLLISRDQEKINHYLPMLHRCVDFIESRRDPKNNLFLAGAAGNLLAPSFAGYKQKDGTYGKSYLTGLSVTYIAALDRMIELEKLVHDQKRVEEYTTRRDSAARGIANLTTPEGYLINSIDPDGSKHGVYGAKEHGYFESSPNHDAIALDVVDDAQARKIYDKIASIPQLRPHAFILPNFPSYDDMYEKPQGLWEFGRWVNGGHWSTCEGRMILAYSRLEKFDDIRASMHQLMKFANSFRMDNPLTNQGDDVYQPNQPINITYDAFAPAAAMIRGLFEYRYSADSLTLVPHVPDGITALRQEDPIRWGTKKIYLRISGKGPITRVVGSDARFTDRAVTLRFEQLSDSNDISICRDNFEPGPQVGINCSFPRFSEREKKLRSFLDRLHDAKLQETYEAAHAALVLQASDAERNAELPSLSAESKKAALQLYHETTEKLFHGLETVMEVDGKSKDALRRRVHEIWVASANR